MDQALALHRQLIEQFVAESPSLPARLVRSEGIFTRAHGNEELNAFVGTLGKTERELLARMLEQARFEAIFDSLRVLQDETVMNGLRLRKGGIELPVEPYGYTLFEEFLTVYQTGSWASLGG